MKICNNSNHILCHKFNHIEGNNAEKCIHLLIGLVQRESFSPSYRPLVRWCGWSETITATHGLSNFGLIWRENLNVKKTDASLCTDLFVITACKIGSWWAHYFVKHNLLRHCLCFLISYQVHDWVAFQTNFPVIQFILWAWLNHYVQTKVKGHGAPYRLDIGSSKVRLGRNTLYHRLVKNNVWKQ